MTEFNILKDLMCNRSDKKIFLWHIRNLSASITINVNITRQAICNICENTYELRMLG